ncbi:hypothetical protein HK104_010629 [Borealophlyctis nickersoniae]|nr:hypothetical protein HK104_010629 [Borealophlyctis nickersoniae]
MTVNVPASGCGQKNCMLFWTLAATHISTTNPEIYDDCMDVTISGGGSNPPPPPPPNNPPPSNPPPSNGGGNCGAAWSKCGGKGFTGPTCCTSGYKCARQDEWYSQCIPN